MSCTGLRALPLVFLTACGGGGGGGAPGANPARLALPDVVLAQGQDRAVLEVSLQGPVTEAALLQFALVFDPTRLGPAAARAVVEPLQPMPTADAEEVEDGRLVVLSGDARNRRPQQLREGSLLRLYLDTRPPRTAGTTTVEIRDILLVDATGGELPVTTAPVTAQVTFR